MENTEIIDGVEGAEIRDPEKVLNALKKANAEAKLFREENETLKTRISSLENADSPFKDRALKAEAKLKLQELGIKDSDRLSKYIDFTKVEIDEEGNITGLDETIETLKGDFPELFDPKRRVGGAADAGSGKHEVKKPLSATEVQAQILLGG